MKNLLLEEEKQGLIDLIKWYRDEYHFDDWGHSKMIEEIADVKTLRDLDHYWSIVDSWLDMRD